MAQAARAALLRLAKPSNHKVLSILLRSGKHEDLVLAFQILSQGLVTRKKQGGRGARRSIVERVTTICQVGHAQVIADAAVDLGTALRSASKSEAAAAAFSYVVGTRDPSQRNTVLARLLKSRTNAIRRGALAAVETFGRRVDIKVILSAYERFPNETAKSILACVQPGDFSLLCQFVQSRQLEPAIRDILIALARAGGNKGVKFIIRLIQNSSERVNVWNVPLLAQSLGECANRSLIPNLKAFMTSLEFWRHIGRSEKTEKHLPVRDSSNVHIFRRVVGTCLAMICSEPEWDILRRLVLHQYSTIRIAAARSIARFATVDHLDSLLSDFRRSTDYEDLDAVRVIDEAIYGKATLAKEFLMSSGLQTTSVTEASRPS